MSNHEGHRESVASADARRGVRLDERYHVQNHLLSTRGSEANYAIQREGTESVTLWRMRFSLGGDAVARFLRRMQTLAGMNLPTPKIRDFGIDDTGRPFVITDFFEGKPIFSGAVSAEEAQRRFLEAVRVLALLHSEDIALGDVGEQSFVITGNGRVLVQGMLGAFDSEAGGGTTMMPAPQTLAYLAPEQRSGGGAIPASDIFALGLIGYQLFTKRSLTKDPGPILYPDEAVALAPAPSTFHPSVPQWLDGVLAKCLSAHPEARYGDATLLLQAIEEAMRTGRSPDGVGRWAQRTLMVRPDTRAVLQSQAAAAASAVMSRGGAPAIRSMETFEESMAGEGVSRSARLFAYCSAGLLLGLVAVGIWILLAS
ncbi:MAG: hypothetical protein KDD44_07885, partial [Bdellovibrionales bacterium]|nr:hypothetical protein [Bdellovibrionales bacterium]